jgi:adenylate kinase
MLAAQGAALDVVVLITADTDEVVSRLLNRAIVEGRADDTESVIRHRLALYEEQTAPLISLYAQRNLVVTVDGLGAVADVTDRIVAALGAKGIAVPVA